MISCICGFSSQASFGWTDIIPAFRGDLQKLPQFLTAVLADPLPALSVQDSTALQFRGSPGVSSALLGWTSQCTELQLALGGSNRNLVELLCSDLCCAQPTGHNLFAVLTAF